MTHPSILSTLGHVAVCAALVVCTNSAVLGDDAKPTREQLRFFETNVRPLLATKCFKCHGSKKQNGKLRLDSRATILAGGETGPAIVIGDPDSSLLIEAINYDSLEMPPSGKLKPNEIAALTKWIEIGAPWPNEPSIATTVVTTPKITDEDRAFWSFQPVRDVTPPKVDDNGWCRNEIDRFIFRRLKKEGLQPSSAAEPLDLMRRVYFDLIGLPPTPEEINGFQQESTRSPNSAIRNLTDRLLDDPRYGERWARHWLDVVRYAESDGYKQDAFRPHAWRYRDYVIRSFNNDKPYDRFVMEQIAGDEIAPNDPEAIIATGYLRHWIYEYNQRDVRTQWDGILNDVTDVTGDVFLGMGMGCARCHDHKFDPILRKDYYRLKAFFAPMIPRDDLPLGTSEELTAYHRAQSNWESKTAEIRKQIADIERPYRRQVANPQIDKFPPDIRPMVRKAAADRTPFEQQLVEMVDRQVREQYAQLDIASKLKGEEKAKYSSLKKQLAEFDKLKPKSLPPAFTISDVGATAPVTFIPGDRKQRNIEPGILSVIDPAHAKISPPAMSSNSTGRRTALARWIASPNNPLSTRVIVNRIWQHHFGRGIVATSSDFGRLGETPTHPELLDWLTKRFIADGWSIKKLHRLIVNSATYQQSAFAAAQPDPQSAIRNPQMIDPSNRLLWKMNVHRLAAEQIRDAMLAVSGELNPQRGGPSVDVNAPRRTIYTKVLRNNRDPLLDVFDAPDNFNSTSERNTTTTPTQSLLMINGQWALDRARAFASRLKRNSPDDSAMIELAYKLAFGRQPTPLEQTNVLSFLDEQAHQIRLKEPKPRPPQMETMPVLKSTAAKLSPASNQKQLHVADNESLPDSDFTIEAIVLLRSLYADATVRTIAAQWDGHTAHPGWALGVTSEKSGYQPRNLILQFVGQQGYEVVASDLRPELNKPYYVAASVKIGDTSKSGITFYLKDLSNPEAEVQTAQVAHKVTGKFKPNIDFTIGGRANSNRHFWDGLIDEVRLSSDSLTADQLSITNESNNLSLVGNWSFEKSSGFFTDTSPKKNNIRLSGDVTPTDPRSAAWIDFCHALLNSNEFLYVD